MQCDACKKNPATVHLTEIVDGKMTELHICESCAREKSVQMEQQFGLSDLLAGLADFGKHVGTKEIEKTCCARCGLTYEDFKKIGRLGCSTCYETFSRYLVPLLKRIHGSAAHVGKFPHGAERAAPMTPPPSPPEKIEPVAAKPSPQKASDVETLKQELVQAIKSEHFEEAARLRDRIRALEKKDRGPTKTRASSNTKERKRKKSSS